MDFIALLHSDVPPLSSIASLGFSLCQCVSGVPIPAQVASPGVSAAVDLITAEGHLAPDRNWSPYFICRPT